MQKKIFIIFWVLLFISLYVSAQERELRKMEALSDTLFQSMSIEELIKIQKILKGRVQKLREEEDKIRGRELEVSKSFIQEGNVRIKDQDKILIRVAEYYIEESDEKYEKDYNNYDLAEERYFELLNQFDRGEIETEPEPPQEPVYDYSKAIEVYDKIIKDYPKSEYADDALYSKAFLVEKMKKGSQARRIYQEVIDKYPESLFAAESYMRLAEYYFAPREGKEREKNIVELQKAIKLYKNVLKYRHSKRYDEALYKLGWSYFKLAAVDPKYYSDAIIYFLAVADDIERAEKLDPKNKISTPSVKEEAITYIGISFSDEETYDNAGVYNARKFIERIGGRAYGVEIMRALGETYQKIENYEQAIDAYTNLLEMYPRYEEAPLITQKIAESYYDMGLDDKEYEMRNNLFANYNPNSEWYNYIDKSEIPDRLKYVQDAYRLSERAAYTNIVLDQEKAQQLESDGLSAEQMWNKVIDGCQKYLEAFGADSNAYTINWNYAFILDAKLDRYEDAFEQYMHVSNDYLEREFQEKSAVNAIFVAETLVTIAYGPQDTSKVIDFENAESLRPDILTDDEKRVIEAYNNYIKLFPDGEMTPVFLAKAGGIYFNHKQFAEAKVYFNTLVKRFPGARQKSIAYRSIMNSYFALGKFRDSELIAKQILQQTDVPDEDKIFAEKRLAQSIFKNAKLLQDQGQYLEAALEYRRVFDESPEEKGLVDAALYNSAYMYDEIQEWQKAVDTYILLADKYPDSRYTLRALNNAAEDYKEMKQYANAGDIFTKIYELNKDNFDVAEPALSNASYYYGKGEEWQKAIFANNEYIAAYPNEAIATELYFANAGNYLKLGNLTEANRIYEEFATRYPTDPKAVEAFYHRGVYFKKNGQKSAAKLEFQKAIDKSEQFGIQGLDPNRYYVGEALNELVAMLYDEFASIRLTQPESNIQSQQIEMKNLLREIVESNKKIVANGSIRSFEAVYNSASIYEDFASIYVNQERKQNIDPNQLFAENKRINEQSAQLFNEAVDQYKMAIKNIPRVASNLGIDIFAAETPDTAQMAAAEEDTSLLVQRAVEKDSTKEIAYKWYKKAEEKISALLYKEAELTRENISQALAMPNPQTDPVAKLIYQLKLVNQIVAPAIKQTIAAHKRNLEEAQDLELHNKYVEESKRQILLTSNILAEEIEKLAFESIADYSERVKDIKELVELEYGATNEKGEDYNMIHSTNQQLIDLSKELANATINNYISTLNFAEEANIKNDLIRTTSDKLFRFAVMFTDIYEENERTAAENHNLYVQKFDSTQNYNYDDASVYFQDYEISFSDYEREILDNAYLAMENYGIRNLWVNKLLVKLIKIDPATYAESIEKDKYEFSTDDSWVYSTSYEQGYVDKNFDDSGWENATMVNSNLNQFFALDADPAAIWKKISLKNPVDDSMPSGVDTTMGNIDTLAVMDTAFVDTNLTISDNLGITPDSLVQTVSDTVEIYFRKIINLPGQAVDGAIYITADDDYRFFLNGEYIIDDEDNDFMKVDSVDYETVSYSLKTGKNIIALDVIDFNNSQGGVKLYGYFEVLPEDITAAAEAKAKVERIYIDPEILKKVNTLNKNRITIHQ